MKLLSVSSSLEVPESRGFQVTSEVKVAHESIDLGSVELTGCLALREIFGSRISPSVRWTGNPEEPGFADYFSAMGQIPWHGESFFPASFMKQIQVNLPVWTWIISVLKLQ